jgi:translation initiation factor 1
MEKTSKSDTGTTGAAISEGDSLFSDVLRELDAEESRIIVRLELRRFRKKTTVVEGLSGTPAALADVARELKKKLATGGSVKDGIIILQGDQRDNVKEILTRMGYSDQRIEVQ